ncbi:coagulation factor XIII B chain-like isoform X3 [Lacerta agilis]|uniref:coagulation factor XIII B chain-like isoform X3 n=1 Tax=Lacerta agilis TaxID=80427 RepID=UPI00141955E3|nr:coagulation factor XIII B chain-like isoform X3 [Lacerta agilis]
MGYENWIFLFTLAILGDCLAEGRLCDLPSIKNGNIAPYYYSFKNYYFPMKQDEKLSYFCLPGYTTESGSQNGKINCTMRGWAPVPKCYQKCTKPALDNGVFSDMKMSYKIWKRLQYSCNPGYQIPGGPRDKTIQCLEGGWSAQPQCTETTETCSAPDLVHGRYHTAQRTFSRKEKLKYECDDGYRTAGGHTMEEAHCDPQGWSLTPKCTKLGCSALSPVEHGGVDPSKGSYEEGNVVQFFCLEGYSLKGSELIQCYYFGWYPEPPVCEDVGRTGSTEGHHGLENGENCSSLPIVDNSFIFNNINPSLASYKTGSVVEYRCKPFHLIEGPNTIRCVQGNWTTPPVCLEPCLVNEGNIRNHNVEMKWNLEEELYFLHGDMIELVCKPGYDLPPSIGDAQLLAQCSRGELKYPTCVSKDPDESCGSPPSIKNGVVMGLLTADYAHGSSVEYSCHEYHFLQGSRKVSCSMGHWTTPPICIEPCTLSAEEMAKNHLDLRWSFDNRPYFLHGEFVEFICKAYYFSSPSSSASDFRAQCQNGQLLYPQCVRIRG